MWRIEKQEIYRFEVHLRFLVDNTKFSKFASHFGAAGTPGAAGSQNSHLGSFISTQGIAAVLLILAVSGNGRAKNCNQIMLVKYPAVSLFLDQAVPKSQTIVIKVPSDVQQLNLNGKF